MRERFYKRFYKKDGIRDQEDEMRSDYECSINTAEKMRKMKTEIFILKEDAENVIISIRD
jgi:hypothetical protein